MMEQLASLFDEEDTKTARAARGQRTASRSGAKTPGGKTGRRAA
jgi:hypothetical protein